MKQVFTGLLIAGILISALFADYTMKAAAPAPTIINGYPFSDGFVSEIHIKMKPSDWENLQNNALDKQYFRADFIYNGQTYENVAVRTKGESSLMSSMENSRLPLKIDFNFFNVSQEFRGMKKLSLNNCYKDPSFMREILGYWLFEQMGIPAPRNAFADLWVNDNHLGLYTMVEQVDKSFIRSHFSNARGDLYKPEWPAGALNWTQKDIDEKGKNTASTSERKQQINSDVNIGGSRFGELLDVLNREGFTGSQKLISETTGESSAGNQRSATQNSNGQAAIQADMDLLGTMGLKTNENSTKHKALYKLLAVLNEPVDDSFPAEIEKVLNVDQVLRYLAVSSLIVHADNYIETGQNYYLYEDNGRFNIIPWDLNESFGSFNSDLNQNAILFNIDSIAGWIDRPLASKLLSYQPYLNKYHQYIKELLDGPFAEDRIGAYIEQIAYVIRPYVEKDTLKFYTFEEFENSIAAGLSFTAIEEGTDSRIFQRNQLNQAENPAGATAESGSGIPLLRAFIEQRRQAVQKQLDG